MENIIIVIVSLSIGYILRLKGILELDSSNVLNKYVLYVSYPAMILLQTPKIHFSNELLVPALIAWGVMILSAILIFILSKIFSFSSEITGSLMLVAVLTNSSFLGIPLLSAYMPNDAFMPYLLVYDQIGTFLAFATYGTIVVSIFTSKTNVSFKPIFIKIVTFPPFLSLIIALFFIGSEFNQNITKTLEAFALTTVPVALVAAGIQLRLKLPKEEIKPFGLALFTKLIFAPIVATSLCAIFGLIGVASKVSILEASMAPMITAGAIASMAGLAPRLSSAIVGYGIFISLITTYIFNALI